MIDVRTSLALFLNSPVAHGDAGLFCKGRAYSPSQHTRLMLWIWFAALMGVLLFYTPAVYAARAGSLISNQVTGQFLDETGLVRTSVSNSVQITVSQVAGLLLEASINKSVITGSTAYFAHTLTNTGNGDDGFDLTVGDETGGFGFSSLQLFADANGDGLPDNNTPLSRIGPLAGGEKFTFVVAAGIPSNLPSGASDRLRIDAISRFDASRSTLGASPSAQPLIDTANITTAPRLSLQKSATPSGAAPAQAGDVLRYLLTVRNTGGAAATSGQAITIDGLAATPILVRDAIAPNTTLQSIITPASAALTPLYHRVGSAQNSYTSGPPADLHEVDAIAWALNKVEASSSVDVSFEVRINDNATRSSSGSIVNTAQLFYNDGTGSNVMNTPSNDVLTPLAREPVQLQNYTAANYLIPAPYARLGNTLYLRADATACNSDASSAETHGVVFTAPNGERETSTATETGLNTGLFTIKPLPTRSGAAVAANDGVLQARSGDIVSVEILGCGVSVVGGVSLQLPFGTVFDSRSNQPIPNAQVSLVQAASDGTCTATPATVQRLVDGVIENAASTVTTNNQGQFEFELVGSGSYCLAVIAPDGYQFASKVPVSELPAGRLIVSTGPSSGASYGGSFTLSTGPGPILVDIPLDTVAAGALAVQKTASRNTAELADFVDYRIQIRNNSTVPVRGAGVQLTDRLPAGFAYIPGSARLDNTALADPQGGQGPKLIFALGPLDAGKDITLSYRVRIGPGALQGDGINRAQAKAGNVISNVASTRVKVQGGVFDARGFIIGKVFLDCNRNRVQDSSEVGIPGVQVVLQDGTSAVTDREGLFSFYGMAPRTHVLKLDMTTMPVGSELIALNHRHAGDAGSSFVDLKNGELIKINFAEGACQPGVVNEVNVRRAKWNLGRAETDAMMSRTFEASAEPRVPGDVRAQPAAGTVAGSPMPSSAGLPITAPVATASSPSNTSSSPSRTRADSLSLAHIDPSAEIPLEKLLPTLSNELGFVYPKNGDILPFAQSNVRIKGTAGAELRLRVNGEQIPAKRVGQKSLLPSRQVQAWEFVGITLQVGRNELVAQQFDSFGNPRGEVRLHVTAPGKLAQINLQPPAQAIADGTSSARVLVQLADLKGVPVTARTLVTIESSTSRWLAEDLDANDPGVQVFIEGGRAEFLLKAPAAPGQIVIRASSGTLKAQATVDFLPNLRPLMASGVLETTLNLRRLDTRALVPAREQDGFEQSLTHLSHEWGSGSQASARAALFLKGKVKGDHLLTLSYDSDKDTRERLFRDIQPDEFYPVYGDASSRGFDAQSSSKLYVRLDKGKSWLLWGDFVTQNPLDTRRLATYSRSLTGIKHHFEGERWTSNAFASRDSSTQATEEIQANGTSGPYRLSSSQAVENSEQIELIVRDRNQPAIILKSTALVRFVDYTLDVFGQQIIFKAPVPSLDVNLNPQSIRVRYEVNQGGNPFWVYGADAQFKVNSQWSVGAIAVQDQNPQDPAQLRGAHTTWRLSDTSQINMEWAQSQKESRGQGQAARVEWRHDSPRLQAQAYSAHSSTAFDNPGSFLTQGRSESGAKLHYKWSEQTTLRSEALRTQDVLTGGVRDGFFASIERSFNEWTRLELGVRHGKEVGQPANPGVTGELPNEFTSLKAKISSQIPKWPQTSVFGEYEQDIHDSARKIAAMGGDYQLANRGRLYFRKELISSLLGPYALNNNQTQNSTVFGLDADYMKDGRLFSEYRVRDAFNGANTEAAIGLRNQWNLREGLRLSTTFERVHVLNGLQTNAATAVTGALEYTASPTWRGSARLELRRATASDDVFSTLGAARQIDSNWTLLLRNSLALSRNKDAIGGHRLQERFQIGMAYRDVETDVWSGLARFEHRLERDSTLKDVDTRRMSNIVSSHINFQPTQAWVATGRAAAKAVTDQSNGIRSSYHAMLLGSRLTYTFTPRWDGSVMGNVLLGRGGARQWGLGGEVGYLVTSNLWLSAGYNLFGFHDPDLAGSDHTPGGAFFRLRFKFDEDLFRSRNPTVNPLREPTDLGSGTASRSQGAR